MILLLSEIKALRDDVKVTRRIPSYDEYERDEEEIEFIPVNEKTLAVLDWLIENLERTKRNQLDTSSDVADFSDRNYWAKVLAMGKE